LMGVKSDSISSNMQINKTELGHIIIGAAIVDDILGLFILAILTTMLSEGGAPSIGELGLLAAKIIGFFLFVFIGLVLQIIFSQI